jgi:hypothetical protein
LGDASFRRWLWLTLGQLMFLGVEQIVCHGLERRKADAAHHVTARFLKTGELCFEIGLSGAGSRLMESKHMIQQMHQHL